MRKFAEANEANTHLHP